ncbi:MAG: bifunctional diaminohydroxyphosphoribosylaminopyrimidine deaminase/5-amino-6-(5-phosphoribosylamino)uracil reductase RibD [Acidimicrobiia bacterium]|nr:bifunctional diaminohydroxyphosphoribosylaminopyrimidine deaminase/5-amino-6-(5-phosphoribosylamino)uracil reductase RibD [Acidimicrobiia bacterium]MYB10964.1 bifunctional diaminohydroxyphosphoribosylaminopyrimidine deaminase/5-amino-6-(5-phosphoribosylamino)uracil reductase RibD [Acidimicrobiia bacterium]MYB73185.1 bifunctional diaminohydroxyphosphoribosylaminopyrimidine deaminase/5-amino-6-(5-phosphoribosylamino)uracil reductase RibD [Acidimicrobiia bacterium]MYG58425.1 bifunctional diamino
MMDLALEAARSCRLVTSPNPWVGCAIDAGESQFLGATSPPGGNHAEVNALEAAGPRAEGADLYTTLEPCDHQGRTGPCTETIVAAGVARVVVAVEDPDPAVSGRGITALREAGIEVEVGVRGAEAAELLAPYLKHRRTGLPWVVLKLAATLDGRIAAPDATSRWITGPEARADVHRLRAESDAVLVGAGTVRADDPELTVRDWHPPSGVAPRASQPRRVVLGSVPPGARVHPALEMDGPLEEVLVELGERGVIQLLVEGGAATAAAFHRAGLVDHYSVYLAPALFGGDDGRPMLAGPGASTIDDLWRGEITEVTRLGPDIRIDLRPQ